MASETELRDALDALRRIQSDLAAQSPRVVNQEAGPREHDGAGPLVFISWAHSHSSWKESQTKAWEASIATLASTLRVRFGIDADVDLFHLDETVDWTRYGQKGVINADRVLVVHSLSWAERWAGENEPTEGAGAAREADTLHGLFSRHQQDWQEKLIIVVLPGVGTDEIPPDLDRVSRVRVDPSDPDSYEDLLRILTGQPRYSKPALGTIPELPPLDSSRNLAALRAQLDEVKRQERKASKYATDENEQRRRQLSTHEAALRGFIETALQGDD